MKSPTKLGGKHRARQAAIGLNKVDLEKFEEDKELSQSLRKSQNRKEEL